MKNLEKPVFKQLRFQPSFYYRYVDDIILTALVEKLPHLLDYFNKYHPRLQFTLQKQTDTTITFLDLTLINSDGFIITDTYHKPTFSGRYLNFYSNHSISQKIDTIIGMVDRAILFSHPSFHTKNLYTIINILISNCYPLTLIFKVIRNRIKFLSF